MSESANEKQGMGFSHRFFENRECRYYPCHDGLEQLNCLFCFCPLYHMEDCPGQYEYKLSRGRMVKSCMGCSYPHRPENYEAIMRLLAKEQG